jgi:hypothetical protein
MRFVIVYQDPCVLHQLQITAGATRERLEQGHEAVPGATKGAAWEEVRASLEAHGWRWVDRALARQPVEGEQPEPPSQRVGCDVSMDRFQVQTTWAAWPQTWPVFVSQEGLRPFMRIVELDGDRKPLRATAWANVAWWPGRSALVALSTSSGLRWHSTAEEVAGAWVALTSLPWPWPLPGSAA